MKSIEVLNSFSSCNSTLEVNSNTSGFHLDTNLIELRNLIHEVASMESRGKSLIHDDPHSESDIILTMERLIFNLALFISNLDITLTTHSLLEEVNKFNDSYYSRIEFKWVNVPKLDSKYFVIELFYRGIKRYVSIPLGVGCKYNLGSIKVTLARPKDIEDLNVSYSFDVKNLILNSLDKSVNDFNRIRAFNSLSIWYEFVGYDSAFLYINQIIDDLLAKTGIEIFECYPIGINDLCSLAKDWENNSFDGVNIFDSYKLSFNVLYTNFTRIMNILYVCWTRSNYIDYDVQPNLNHYWSVMAEKLNGDFFVLNPNHEFLDGGKLKPHPDLILFTDIKELDRVKISGCCSYYYVNNLPENGCYRLDMILPSLYTNKKIFTSEKGYFTAIMELINYCGKKNIDLSILTSNARVFGLTEDLLGKLIDEVLECEYKFYKYDIRYEKESILNDADETCLIFEL